MALETILYRDHTVYHKFLHNCPYQCSVFITHLEHLSLVKIYRGTITMTFTHQQMLNPEHSAGKKKHAIKLGKILLVYSSFIIWLS